MEPENLTVRVLIEIREQLRSNQAELSTTREELRDEIRGVRDALVVNTERLDRIEGVVRDVNGHLAMIGRSVGVTRANSRKQTRRLDDLEKRVDELERRRT